MNVMWFPRGQIKALANVDTGQIIGTVTLFDPSGIWEMRNYGGGAVGYFISEQTARDGLLATVPNAVVQL